MYKTSYIWLDYKEIQKDLSNKLILKIKYLKRSCEIKIYFR